MNLDGAPELTDLPWRTNTAMGSGIRFRNRNNGVEISIKKRNKKKSLYLIQNAYSRHFKKLDFLEGVPVQSLDGLLVGSHGTNDKTLSCTIIILEYNDKNDRIGTVKIPLNTSSVYKPTGGTKRCIVCVNLAGYGQCTLYGIRFEKLNQPSAASEASTLPNLGPELTGAISEDNVFVRYSDVKKIIATEAATSGQAEPIAPADFRENFNNLSSIAHKTLTALAGSLPVSDGSRYYKKIPLKAGIITDVYMYNFYKDVFDDIYYLSPGNYEEVLSSVKLDLLLYVTCWRGIDSDEWQGVKFREKPAKAFENIIKKARADGAKLVFQSIEDPSNFDYFLPLAKEFDYIFTTDIQCVGQYMTECGHERVYYGEYGANPHFNNPIGCRRHSLNAAFFAGSWAPRYKERCEDMETAFNSILASGGDLAIADRNRGLKEQELQYPPSFQRCVIPAIDHALLQSMHKIFRYNLNFNSIKNSPTMCAMRIYEMQAMGIGIFSNYAKSVFNNFPEVRLIPWAMDMTDDFSQPESLDEYRQKMNLVSNILNDKTAYDVATQMVQKIGFTDFSIVAPVVCVICEPEFITEARQQLARQRYSQYVIAGSADFKTQAEWEKFRQEHHVEYFTWFSPQHEYERGYIDNLMNAFKYTRARYVTHLAWFDGERFHDGEQHEYTRTIGGKARSIFSAEEFSPEDFRLKDYDEEIADIDGGYAIDPFELNYIRYVEYHKQDAQEFDPKLSVIVPVFNNGRFLKSKCIESLKRNKLWPEMEILLVDDSSTDQETLDIINELVREHANVKSFFFDGGNSGSASRPRNKGIDLATAPLIAFLDPDNEISPGGYDALVSLYHQASEQDDRHLDFIAGFHVKVEEQAKIIGKRSDTPLLFVDDLKARFLESGKFPLIPTQPTVISRKLFEDGALRFVEKAVGQDTLFGWELLCHAKLGAFTDAAYLIYYAQRISSIVNVIDSVYFQKKLILETAQVKVLKDHGIFDAYMRQHFDNFMRGWYLPKLRSVADEAELAQCLTILKEIAQLYGRDLDVDEIAEMH